MFEVRLYTQRDGAIIHYLSVDPSRYTKVDVSKGFLTTDGKWCQFYTYLLNEYQKDILELWWEMEGKTFSPRERAYACLPRGVAEVVILSIVGDAFHCKGRHNEFYRLYRSDLFTSKRWAMVEYDRRHASTHTLSC